MSSAAGRLVLLAFLLVGICLAVASALASGVWHDLWLGLFIEVIGAAFIVFLIDRIFDRSRELE